MSVVARLFEESLGPRVWLSLRSYAMGRRKKAEREAEMYEGMSADQVSHGDAVPHLATAVISSIRVSFAWTVTSG